MLTEICAEIKNYFTCPNDKLIGDWRIADGQIAPSIDFPTDYIRIVGSRKNDGVHVLSDNQDILADEDTFHGAIWLMSPPPAFIALCEEIKAWQDAYGGALGQNMGPFASESFGGYSYSKGSGSGGSGASGVPTWLSQYASRLSIYRKI